MKQKQVYKISVFLSIIGLTLMYASSQYLEPEKVDIGNIDESSSGKVLEVEGTALNVTKSSSNLFIDLKDSTGSILVVQFDSKISVNEGDSVSIIGSVELYEGELEIIAREIEIKSNQ